MMALTTFLVSELEAAMRSEPVSVARARPEWKERVDPGVFQGECGGRSCGFRAVDFVNQIFEHSWRCDIPIRNHSRISCQPSGSSLHQSRVTWLEVEFGVVERCPVELVIFC